METSNNKLNSLDWLSLGCIAVGAPLIAFLTQQMVTAILPVSAAGLIEIFNRKEELVKVQTSTHQELVKTDSKLEGKFKTQQVHLTSFEQQTTRNINLSQQKLEEQIKEVKESLLNVSKELQEEKTNRRESILNLTAQEDKLNQEQHRIKDLVNGFRKIEELLTQIQYQPGSAEFYYQSGVKNQGLNDYNSAVEDYTQAISLKAEYAEAYYNRGLVYAKLNNRKRAIEDLRQAAKIYFEHNNLEKYNLARTMCKEIYNPSDLSQQTQPSSERKEQVSQGKIEADQLFA